MSLKDLRKKPAERQPLQRLHIFTHPRTASSLLVKILNLLNQPGVVSARGGGYFFLSAERRLRELNPLRKCHDQWPEAEREEVQSLYKECLEKLKDFVASAEESGQTMVIKEHVLQMVDSVSKSNYIYGPKTIPGSQLLHGDSPTRTTNMIVFRMSFCSRSTQHF